MSRRISRINQPAGVKADGYCTGRKSCMRVRMKIPYSNLTPSQGCNHHSNRSTHERLNNSFLTEVGCMYTTQRYSSGITNSRYCQVKIYAYLTIAVACFFFATIQLTGNLAALHRHAIAFNRKPSPAMRNDRSNQRRRSRNSDAGFSDRDSCC